MALMYVGRAIPRILVTELVRIETNLSGAFIGTSDRILVTQWQEVILALAKVSLPDPTRCPPPHEMLLCSADWNANAIIAVCSIRFAFYRIRR